MSPEALKKIARQHIDLTWNKGRLGLVARLHSKDFIYKSSFANATLDSDGFVELVEGIRHAMPDIQVVIEDCIVEGLQVCTWSTMIGIISQPAFGYPASDKVVSIAAMAFWRFNNKGEIQEICSLFDMESFRAQMGLSIRPLAQLALP